ncbi:hypothetical protein A2801_00545 [Candidatus Woesebacteria bacterium RIFCSPHIGHO2_01_FULL_41_10]|uniref:Glycosyltransferase RgtA/B/C/D-like domain-containing protein n=1 Tax=Candidatus Woesebacteria bacterium RIFCSPHIGHO2_01_FULL_41_10 TaxID=1802500 RepID=A0A1F7YRQ4_9BACT|nr:MAG: hypothetical protein A2801_00545 [Candidatus Woesebacteria bacterium RIFCSPHIGHO2_01_FULL_41_10]
MTRVEKILHKTFSFFEEKLDVLLIFSFSVSIFVRLIFSKYDFILRKDAFTYLLKSIEITNGNFTPVYSHEIGLSLFTAPLLLLFRSLSIYEKMIIAKTTSCLIGASIIFPLYLITKELKIAKRAQILTIILFTFYTSLVSMSEGFLTEPLFTLVFLFSIYFVIKSLQDKKYIIFSFIFAALSWWIRPTGAFVFVILFISTIILHRNKLKRVVKSLLFGVLAFCAVAAPFIILRYSTFGSFSYGENDKFLVDAYEMVWSNNIPITSAVGYLQSHGIYDIFVKFVLKGLFKVIFDFFYGSNFYTTGFIVSPLIAIFYFFGLLNYFAKRKYAPLIISFFIYIGGLSIIYSIFGTQRHLLPMVPFVLVFSALGLYELSRKIKYTYRFLSLFVIVFILFSLVSPLMNKMNEAEPHMPQWAAWAANNIQGKIGIIDGGELIMMHLSDTSVSGVNQIDLYASKSNLSVTRPGYFTDLAAAMPYFQEIGLTHLALDKGNIDRRPYLKEVYLPQYSSLFTEIYSDFDSGERWEMKIYKINYD